jgi:hypothetical protein
VAIAFLILMVAALCVAQWYWTRQSAQRWQSQHPDEAIPHRLFDGVGLILMVSAGMWLAFAIVSSQKKQKKTDEPEWWRFDAGALQTVFAERSAGRAFVWRHGLIALAGFAIGLALTLKLVDAVGWQDSELLTKRPPIGLVAVAILAMALAARRIRHILFLQFGNLPRGEQARELARQLEEEERAEAKAQWEYNRKRITIGPYVILVGGWIGGVWLASRLFREYDASVVGQSIIAGIIATAALLYLTKLKPPGWRLWLSFSFVVALGFLLFTHASWHRPVRYAALGTVWGALVGTTATALYLRKLRRQ